MTTLKIAGIAGGVGTTVLATILKAEDIGRNIESADVVVARNDYRSAHALVEADLRVTQLIVVIIEPGRALTTGDIEDAIGRPVIALDADPAIARSDDAGLLFTDRPIHRRIRNVIEGAIAS